MMEDKFLRNFFTILGSYLIVALLVGGINYNRVVKCVGPSYMSTLNCVTEFHDLSYTTCSTLVDVTWNKCGEKPQMWNVNIFTGSMIWPIWGAWEFAKFVTRWP